MVPTFGLDTIRKFTNNVSELKHLAARDFEDILQVCTQKIHHNLYNHLQPILKCIIPVFEGLFPEKHRQHEKDIIDTLFLLATWHAYAKLRLHTEDTLDLFEQLTAPLGENLRLFAGKITKDFVVKELPKETAAKARRTAANLKQKISKGKKPAKAAPIKKSAKGKQSAKKSRGKKPEQMISMSLLTYKLHALGDYVQTIRQRGTTDSYNSQTVSILLHSETILMGRLGRV